LEWIDSTAMMFN